ncbi:MAG: prepilin-type N-terminal cleavage/methylation domain-containing protein [Sandaracinus sp.]|nr:prepilin-type N-terminal cleavage/methylation domain-containing protein [Sandaracinus sp.]MCB9611327.1 prepilin-type N-terminal cleavage/methylation domain-containing protein [Sandaracinus sp.]MCB9633311.1 prepilin-type N-terminal cleavage/methylation domain-containing protein [Sandaracinus sp.]
MSRFRTRRTGMRRRGGRVLGMTLVEAMVSIAILSVVSVMVWGGFSQTSKNKERVEADLDRNHIVSSALSRMQRELSMAYVSAQVNPSPALVKVNTCFVGTDRSGGDRIDFTSFSHRRLFRDAHESDQNEISYFVTRHPTDQRRKVLARREQRRIDDDPRRGGEVQILVDDVTDLELEYLDPLTTEWVRTWDTTQLTGQPSRLPAQVRIRLTVPHPRRRGSTVTYGTRAELPMRFALNHAVYNP